MEGYQWGGKGGRERMGEKVQGIRSINGRYKNRQVVVKNSRGNGEAKELTCMTHGHELREGVGNAGGRGCAGWRRIKGRKWDNCNSIINKIYLKIKK